MEITRGGRTAPLSLSNPDCHLVAKIIELLLSAIFAALTSILAKIGIEGVDSNLATAIRTVVVVGMAWIMVFITHAQNGLSTIGKRSWIFLILSGLATGASWLCYYKALQMGEASKVVPIDKLSVVITLVLAFVFLHEQFTVKSILGCILIGVGTLLMVV
jgi:transporter family protein